MTVGFDPRRVFLVTFAAVALVQAAWILAVPAFRGSDEFDHVYKAASVARGQWTARTPAPDGRGSIVTIPRDIVTAASPVCRMYHYTGHDNCFPIRAAGGGDVEVATAAGAYNPAYYLVTGVLSRPFHGAGVDYAMRILTALGSALLVAWAAAVTARWATTAWPFVTLAVGLTPVLLYSTAIAAPNGLTYASATLVWSAVMAFGRPVLDARGLVAASATGCVVLVSTHTTGLVWLAFIVLAALVLRSPRHWLGVLRARPWAWTVAVTTVTVAIALCVGWIRFASTNSLGGAPAEQVAFPWGQVPVFQARWTLQAIGAFPLRKDPAPAPVYAIYGLILVAIVISLFRHAVPRERTAAATVMLVLVVVPTILTLVSYSSQGVGWQGRYSLPLWLGVTAIAGVVLDRRSAPSRTLLAGAFAALAAGMALSALHVAAREADHGPADPLASAVPAGFVAIAVLAVAGFVLPLAAMLVARDAGRRNDAAEDRAAAKAMT